MRLLAEIRESANIALIGEGRRSMDAGYAVYVHLYYDVIDFVVAWLKKITYPASVLISLVEDSPAYEARESLKSSLAESGLPFRIFTIRNLGSDVVPFLVLNGYGVFDGFNFVCKLHGKRTLRHRTLGLWWAETMFRQTLLDAARVVRALEQESAFTPRLIGARDLLVTDERFWGSNKKNVDLLLRAFGVRLSEEQVPFFFAGTSFWISSAALQDLRVLDDAALFESDLSYGADGTFGHSFERVIALAEILNGHMVADSAGAFYHKDLLQPGLINERLAQTFG